MKDFNEVMREEEERALETHRQRVASGEDTRERGAFRQRSEAEEARMEAHGLIELQDADLEDCPRCGYSDGCEWSGHCDDCGYDDNEDIEGTE